MTNTHMDITELAEWQALRRHAAALRDTPLRELFAQDPQRFDRFSLRVDELLADFSRQRITAETLTLLHALARAVDISGWTRRMFAGEAINVTEGRAVLHTALRNRSGAPVHVGGSDVMADVNAVLAQMRRFVTAVHRGSWRGHTGKRLRHLVNIGIGGSDLGPVMVTEALADYAGGGLSPHFVSNVDPGHLSRTLAGLDAERALFIVTSKTFTTQETMANAARARAWLVAQLGAEAAVARHFVAVSTNAAAVRAFGIASDSMFRFWDWVGGRYSLWSAVGLAIALALGMDHFEALLDGAHAMDLHFRDSEPERNLPLTLALLGVWNSNFLGATTHAVVPYAQALHRLPAYLQQADMESNGKSATRDGALAHWSTGPVVWGEPGTNAQHAFFQLLHQGTHRVPVDFIVAARGARGLGGTDEVAAAAQHRLLLANCLAQSAALMHGRDAQATRAALAASGQRTEDVERLLAHRTYAGNQPSTTLLLRELDPRTLGCLIALYEHKIFCQGVIWQVCSFDQWGVELGKELAQRVLPLLEGDDLAGADTAARSLIEQYRRWK